MNRNVWLKPLLVAFVFFSLDGLDPLCSQPSPGGKDFVSELLAAKTKEERQRLLSERKAHVTLENLRQLHIASNRNAKLGNFADAHRIGAVAFEMAEALGNPSGVARSYLSRGLIHFAQSQYAKALADYEQALPLFQKAADRRGEAAVRNSFANLHLVKGDYDQALAEYEASLLIDREQGDKPAESRELNNIGEVYRLKGLLPEALERFQASLEIDRALQNPLGVAEVQGNIGNIYLMMNRYDEAMALFEESLQAYRKMGDKAGEALILGNMGVIFDLTGRYARALIAHEGSLKLKEAIHDYPGQIVSLNNIGVIYQLLNRHAEALKKYQESLALAERAGDPLGQARAWNNIGGIHQRAQQPELALEAYRKSLRTERALGNRIGAAQTRGNIAGAYKAGGKLHEALAELQAILNEFRVLKMEFEEAVTLHKIGEVHQLLGETDKAIERFTAAIQLAESVRATETSVQAWTSLGHLRRAQKEWIHAADAYRTAIRFIEQTRARTEEPSLQISFLSQHRDAYFHLVTCLVALHRTEEAWQTAERAKARTLVELLERGKADVAKAITPEEKKQQQTFNERVALANIEVSAARSQPVPRSSRLAELEAKLNAARNDLDVFQRQLHLRHPELAVQRGEFQPLGFEEIAAMQKTNSVAILEYLIGEEQSYLFTIVAEPRGAAAASEKNLGAHVRVYPLQVKRSELVRQVKAFRERIEKQSLRLPLEESHALYQLLVAPAEGNLQANNRLCIIPDGILWELPFQALRHRAHGYLIESNVVFYAPSITALLAMKNLSKNHRDQASRTRGESESLLVMAHPEFGPARQTRKPLLGSFDEIPGTERQGREIASLFGKNAKLYLRSDATEGRAKQECGHYRYLHFATHGVYEPNHPMYSGLVLTGHPAGKEDGYWEAREIMDANLTADLVVLSACETARGEIESGEGIWGLAWALFVAGTPSSVLSQWKVADQSTAELMVEFYRNLASKTQNAASRLDKAEALQKAQLKLLRDRKWSHPFHWAPFVLIGDWQ